MDSNQDAVKTVQKYGQLLCDHSCLIFWTDRSTGQSSS